MLKRMVQSAAAMLVLTASIAGADPIDFSALVGANAADADGQNFVWTLGTQTGIVNVRSTWSSIVPIAGALRTPTLGPASLANPFTGRVTFTFDAPVEVAFLATIRSLTRDGLEGGRFEQVRLSSPGPVQFFQHPDTTAVYSGVGTNSITADDEFSATPTLSLWGFVGIGAATMYELQYTSTHVGLSETFNVRVIPEPTSLIVAISAIAGVAFVARRRNDRISLSAERIRN